MCFFRVCQLQVWILWRLKENVKNDGIMILSREPKQTIIQRYVWMSWNTCELAGERILQHEHPPQLAHPQKPW